MLGDIMNGKCKYCGGDIEIRNPTGKCDHLYYPENVNKDLNRVEAMKDSMDALTQALKQSSIKMEYLLEAFRRWGELGLQPDQRESQEATDPERKSQD
jgi:hypothetical protein